MDEEVWLYKDVLNGSNVLGETTIQAQTNLGNQHSTVMYNIIGLVCYILLFSFHNFRYVLNPLTRENIFHTPVFRSIMGDASSFENGVVTLHPFTPFKRALRRMMISPSLDCFV
jgi:hypothetical protein